MATGIGSFRERKRLILIELQLSQTYTMLLVSQKLQMGLFKSGIRDDRGSGSGLELGLGAP